MEIKKVMTSDLPIKKNPFIAFEIVDKTLPSTRKEWLKNSQYIYKNIFHKKYVAYVNPNNDEDAGDMWGTPPTTATSYTLSSTGSSIKPEALHDVVVSLINQINI